MLAAFDLVMALAAGFGIASLFGFEGTEKGVFVLMAPMPVSVATYLFVELHTPDSAPDVASLIMVSTIMTVAVLPLVMTYGL